MDVADRERAATYALLAVSALASALSLVTLNVLLIGVTSVLALLSFFLCKAWYMIDAKLFEKSGVVQVLNGFELSGDRSAATHTEGGLCSATAAVVVEVLGDKEIDREKVENLIAHVGFPFKIVLSVERLDMKSIFERLETGRVEREIRLSRLQNRESGRGMLLAARLKREIELMEEEIRSMKRGTPLRLVHYIMTSAISESRYRAEELAKSQARELSAEFDAAFNAKSKVVLGAELVGLMRFDSTLVIE